MYNSNQEMNYQGQMYLVIRAELDQLTMIYLMLNNTPQNITPA